MPDLLCGLDLPGEHGLWQVLETVGTIHRTGAVGELERRAASGCGHVALAGPGLDPALAARLAARLHLLGIPLVLVIPADAPISLLLIGEETPVHGYLPVNSGTAHAASVVRAAIGTFRHAATLARRLRRLEEAWPERKLVEQAKGVLMARQCLSEDQAHRALQTASMNRRTRMVEEARRILAATAVHPAPAV